MFFVEKRCFPYILEFSRFRGTNQRHKQHKRSSAKTDGRGLLWVLSTFRVGSHASARCEPGQAGNRAAISIRGAVRGKPDHLF